MLSNSMSSKPVNMHKIKYSKKIENTLDYLRENVEARRLKFHKEGLNLAEKDPRKEIKLSLVLPAVQGNTIRS